MYTTPKPTLPKELPLNVWTTVVILDHAKAGLGSERIVYDYGKIQGHLKPGFIVGKIRIRALRDGITEGKTGFDETANHDVAVVADENGFFTWCVPTTWIGAKRQNTLHWQVKPSLYVADAECAPSRHAADMIN